MIDRPLAFCWAKGFVQLAKAQALKCVGLQRERLATESRNDLRCPGKEQVSGKNGNVIAPHLVCCLNAAAHRRAVHHVIVIERCQVGKFNHDGGSNKFFALGIT